jgi:hypothetical protein
MITYRNLCPCHTSKEVQSHKDLVSLIMIYFSYSIF